MNSWDNIKGFTKLSLVDWPGKAVATIFLGGCNFGCPTCHNWQLATEPDSIDSIPRKEVMDYLQLRRDWLDGVVVTGGEPTITADLVYILIEIKALGLPVNLHTNGFRPEVVRNLLDGGLVDVFSVDVKGPWAKYRQLTGFVGGDVAQARLTEIFGMAKENPEKFYFRTTHVPMLSDADIETCRSYLPKGQVLHVQEYREPLHFGNPDALNNLFGCVLVINNESNEDVHELPASEILPVLRRMGFNDPVSAIQNGGNSQYTIIDNL